MQPTDSKNSTILDTSQQPNETQTITIPPSKKKSKPSSKTRRRLKDAEHYPLRLMAYHMMVAALRYTAMALVKLMVISKTSMAKRFLSALRYRAKAL